MDRDFSALAFKPRQRRLLPSIPPKRIIRAAEPEKIEESPLEDALSSGSKRAEETTTEVQNRMDESGSENLNLVVGSPSTSLMAEILAPSPMFSPLLTPVHNSPHSENSQSVSHSDFESEQKSEHSESPITADSVHLDLFRQSSAAHSARCRSNNSHEEFTPFEQTAGQNRLTSSATHCRRFLPAIHRNSHQQIQVHQEIQSTPPFERREAFFNNRDLPHFPFKRYQSENQNPYNSEWADKSNYENYNSTNSRNFYVQNRFHSDETDGPSENLEINEKFTRQSESELDLKFFSRSDSRDINFTVSSEHEKPHERLSPEVELHRLYQGNPTDFHSSSKNLDDSDSDEFI